MPSAAPLLAHRRVLGAADRGRRPVAGDADVAADALADLLEPALLDLHRQERVGDRRPRGPDQVEHAVPDEPDHRVGRGEPADAYDGLRGELLEAAEVLLGPGLVPEPRGDRVVLPEADHEVPDVRELAEQAEQLLGLALADAGLALQLVDDEAAGDRRAPLALLTRLLEHLAEEASAVLERAAVLVGAVVPARREEVLQRRQAVGGIDVDDVVARLERTAHRLPVAAAQVADVVAAHPPRLDRLVHRQRQM